MRKKLPFLLWLVTAFIRPALSAVGFEQISVPDPQGKNLSVAVWYPSVGKSVSVAVGPFQQVVVPNGVVSGTALPLILISHGTAGSAASHYDTALALAEEGFVVAALTHTGDNYMDQSYVGNRRDLLDRPRQASLVLSFMLETWSHHERLQVGRVGMFGFSLGGFTTLVESGGVPELNRMLQLCSARPNAPECRFVRERNGDQLSPENVTPVWDHDPRVEPRLWLPPQPVTYLGQVP